jgi:hypothetical protein
MISTEQRIMIKQICDLQIESFKELKRNHLWDVKEELSEEGYEVDSEEIINEFERIVAQWMKVKNKPEKFLSLLDDQQQGMLKHHLVNEFEDHYTGKGIWKKINLFEAVRKLKN